MCCPLEKISYNIHFFRFEKNLINKYTAILYYLYLYSAVPFDVVVFAIFRNNVYFG